MLFAGGMYTGALPITAKQIADAAGVSLVGLTIAFFVWLFLAGEWTPVERKRLYAILALFLAATVFWSEFEQAGSTLNLFADRATRTSILGWEFPSGYFQSLQPLFIIALAPVFAWIWMRLGARQPSSPAKFALGLLFVGSGFALLVVAAQLAENGVKVAPYWLVVTYLLHTLGELSLSPVGMSAFTKLAPARVAGLMMGVFYLAIAGRQLHRRPAGVAVRIDAAPAVVRPDRGGRHRRRAGHVRADAADQAADGRRQLAT